MRAVLRSTAGRAPMRHAKYCTSSFRIPIQKQRVARAGGGQPDPNRPLTDTNQLLGINSHVRERPRAIQQCSRNPWSTCRVVDDAKIIPLQYLTVIQATIDELRTLHQVEAAVVTTDSLPDDCISHEHANDIVSAHCSWQQQPNAVLVLIDRTGFHSHLWVGGAATEKLGALCIAEAKDTLTRYLSFKRSASAVNTALRVLAQPADAPTTAQVVRMTPVPNPWDLSASLETVALPREDRQRLRKSLDELMLQYDCFPGVAIVEGLPRGWSMDRAAESLFYKWRETESAVLNSLLVLVNSSTGEVKIRGGGMIENHLGTRAMQSAERRISERWKWDGGRALLKGLTVLRGRRRKVEEDSYESWQVFVGVAGLWILIECFAPEPFWFIRNRKIVSSAPQEPSQPEIAVEEIKVERELETEMTPVLIKEQEELDHDALRDWFSWLF